MNQGPINGDELGAPPKDEPELAGVDPVFHDCVRTYGREMFMLVNNGEQAGAVFGMLAMKLKAIHRDAEALGYLQGIQLAFNVIANEYAIKCGMDAADIHNCRIDWQKACKSKIVLATPESGLIVPH